MKDTVKSIINQAYYFAISIAILNLALPFILWLFNFVPFMPAAVFIRELSFSLVTVVLASLMKYKKHLLSAILLFSLACLQMILILISLFLSYEMLLTGLSLISIFYIALGILIVFLSLFFYYRAMRVLTDLKNKKI